MTTPAPVVRAEGFYRPPRPQPADAWQRVPAAERVWRWVESRTQRRLAPPAGHVIGARAYPRINHGRWVADCPCGSAQVVTPADPRLACTECGYGWVELVFPQDVAAAEAAVSADLPHERNWQHPDDPAARPAEHPAQPAEPVEKRNR